MSRLDDKYELVEGNALIDGASKALVRLPLWTARAL